MTRGTWKNEYGNSPCPFKANQELTDVFYLNIATFLQNTVHQGLHVEPSPIHNHIHHMNVTQYVVAPSDWSCLENIIRIQSLLPKSFQYNKLLTNDILKTSFYSFRVFQTQTELNIDVFFIVKEKYEHNVWNFYGTNDIKGKVVINGFPSLLVNNRRTESQQILSSPSKLHLIWKELPLKSNFLTGRLYYISSPGVDVISDGSLLFETSNVVDSFLNTSIVLSVPHFLKPKGIKCYLNQTDVNCNAIFPTSPVTTHHSRTSSLSLMIPPKTTLKIKVFVSLIYQHRSIHSPEPQKGWDVPSVECFIDNEKIFISNNVLVGLPAPDFSMPYNVIALTLSLFALGIGNLIDIAISKRRYLLENDQKSNLPTIALLLVYFYNTIKNKFTKTKEVEESVDDNNENVVDNNENVDDKENMDDDVNENTNVNNNKQKDD
ncbi:GPI transamidase component PIG-T [Entamoeba marina]